MPNDNKKYIPVLRFPEFQNDGEWKRCKLSDIAIRKGKKNTTGVELPVYTNSATSGVINQEEYFDREIVTKDNLVNYGIIESNDFVYNPRVSVAAPVGPISRNKLSRGIMSPLYLIFGFNSGDINFFEHYFKGNSWHSYLRAKANYGARFDRINIGTKEFMDMPVPYPSLVEQKKIADCLSSLDSYIDATKHKLEQLKEHKKGLMQKLFPVKGKAVPELRFPEFQNDGEWGWKKLGEFLYEHKTKSDGKCEVHSVSVSKGVINQKMYLGRSFAASDTSNYKLVKPNDVIYTKSPTGDFPFGIVKQSFLDYNVIVSPLYAVYSPTNRYVGYLIQAYFESPIRLNNYLYPIVKKGAKNTIQITNEEFLSREICLPSNENEQQKIADCLSSLDNAIAALENKTFELETHKKGLLQQIFPNNII